MSLDAVIKVAEGEVGYTESPPNSNRVKYWDIFGPEWQGQPWCVAFLAWCFRQAGESAAFFGGALTASCGRLLQWYQLQYQTVAKAIVMPGDIVILNFSGTKDTEHCGLVTETSDTVNLSNGTPLYIHTIEGNTSDVGSQDNGGMVCRKVRYPRQIVGVCRPNYKEEPMAIDDIKGHWAEAEIRRCIRRGLIKGYPDGSFQPEKPVTRAELAAVVDRLIHLIIGEDDGE